MNIITMAAPSPVRADPGRPGLAGLAWPGRSGYRGQNVGTYFADIVVDDKIILECKSVESFHPSMESQLINYLKISGVPVGYLINFRNRQVQWRRCLSRRA